MQTLSPFALIITTYEIDQQGKNRPTLSHVFWGDTYEQAVGSARSHLKTDVFFSSTFIGQLALKDKILYLSYNGEYLGLGKVPDLELTLNNLAEQAKIINEKQRSLGIIKTVQVLFSEK